jgi:hypothetical protein
MPGWPMGCCCAYGPACAGGANPPCGGAMCPRMGGAPPGVPAGGGGPGGMRPPGGGGFVGGRDGGGSPIPPRGGGPWKPAALPERGGGGNPPEATWGDPGPASEGGPAFRKGDMIGAGVPGLDALPAPARRSGMTGASFHPGTGPRLGGGTGGCAGWAGWKAGCGGRYGPEPGMWFGPPPMTPYCPALYPYGPGAGGAEEAMDAEGV